MTQKRDPKEHDTHTADEAGQVRLAEAMEEAAPPFNLPPLQTSRPAEIRVPASINGRDLSQGQP